MSANYRDLQRPGFQLGPYTIERLIGEGGMGQVNQGYETSTHRLVAIKVISQGHAKDQTMVQRFLNEGKALSMLNSPNVVTVYSVGEDQGLNYIAMEYIEGRSLADICANYALPGPEAAPIFIQLLRGLDALNSKGIVHRDLKPQNILFQKENMVKILDLGIAKVYGTQTLGATSTGMIVGTVQYIAPEIAAGQPATVLSDMWSLGAILYEIVCGTPLIRAASPIEALRKLATLKITFPPEIRRLVDPDMQLIIQRICDPIPQRRFASTQQAIAEFEAYSQKHPPNGLWQFKFLGTQIENAEKVKKDLERKGFRPITVKRILIEAISEDSTPTIPEIDTDKTVSLVSKATIKIKDASVNAAITRLKMAHNLPTPPPQRSNKVAWSVAATILLLVVVTGWLKLSRVWKQNSAKKDLVAAQAPAHAPAPVTAPGPDKTKNQAANPKAESPASPEKVVAPNSTATKEPIAEAEQPVATEQSVAAEPAAIPEAPAPKAAKKNVATPPANKDLFASRRPKLKNSKSVVTLEVAADSGRDPASAAQLTNPPTISWDGLTGASNYRVEIAADAAFKQTIFRGTSEATNYTWKDPALGLSYWRVRAVTGSGKTSSYSDVGELKVRAPSPQLRVATPASKGGPVKVSWSRLPLVNKYRLTVFADSRGEKQIQESVVSVPSAQLNLKPGQYWAAVVAVDSNGRPVGDRSPTSAITVNLASSLASPELLSPPDSTSIFISSNMPVPTVFYWKVAPKATNYELQVARATDFANPVLSINHQTNRLIVTQQFQPGTYYWRVRSKTADSSSDWSQTRSLKIEQGD